MDIDIVQMKLKVRYLQKENLEQRHLLLQQERLYIEPIQISCIKIAGFLV
nr:MAG TPA: hypothetical protein [Bacteriophage sp.]